MIVQMRFVFVMCWDAPKDCKQVWGSHAIMKLRSFGKACKSLQIF